MSDPSLAFQGWINNVLRAGNVGVGTRVHDRVPAAAGKPYASFGAAQTLSGPGDGECFETFEIFQTIDVWSDSPGHSQTKEIAAACRALLHGKMPALDGYRVLHPTRVATRYLPDADGLMTHAVIDVQAIVGVRDTTPLSWSVAGPTAVAEGENAVFTVSYTGDELADDEVASVTVSASKLMGGDEDATPAIDFAGISSLLTFVGGGVTQRTVSVSTIGDTEVEGTEDFRVTLSAQSHGTLAASQANTIIIDDD